MTRIKMKRKIMLGQIHPVYFTSMEAPIYLPNLKKIEGIYTKESGDFVHRIGAAFAVGTKLTNGENLIVTDEFFKCLPKYAKLFIINHEIGHIINNDIIKDHGTDYMIDRIKGKYTDEEFAADEYAASKIGKEKSIAALTFMIRNTDLPLISKIELYRRRANIKKKEIIRCQKEAVCE